MIVLSAHLGTLFQERDPLERPGAAREAGFAVVEAWWPPGPDPARWAAAVRAAGVRAVVVNADGGDLAAGERGFCNLPGRRSEVVASARAAAEVVTAAGGDRVNLLAGRLTADRPEEDQLASAAETVRAAAEAVAPLGVTIVVEHLNAVEVERPLLPTPAAAAAFAERVGHPGVRVLFDAYHAAMAGLDPLEEAARVAPLIGHVQFADHPGRGAPGTGTLDLWALVDRLGALGYDGAVGLEFLPAGRRPRRHAAPEAPRAHAPLRVPGGGNRIRRSEMAVQERAFDVVDPARGTVLGRVGEAGEDGAAEAVEAAAAAQRAWARTPPAGRGEALRAAAAALRARADEVARLQSRENGRPLAESLGGVMAGAGTLDEYGAMATMPRGRTLAGAWDATDFAAPEPRGVAAALVPWNDPIAIACGPIGACLAAGNAIVVKPSEKTPLSTMLLADVLAPHLPDGVLRVVTGGPETGRALIGRNAVRLVLHTGSVATGREVAAECGRRLVKAVLELGGKDPLIVDEGIDPEWAAGQAATGAFANAGQVCTSVERIYVHRAVADAFVAALAERALALRAGDPLDSATTLGPLIDEGQRDVVEDHVGEALALGAQAIAGGGRLEGDGFFHQPTVLTGVSDSMRVMRDETFGPVAAIQTVDTFDEAIRLANDGEYGLAATVLTPSQANAQRAWRELQVGTVKINAVWGGAPGGSAEPRRGSGLGLGYGPGLLREVSAQKVVHMEPARSPSA